MIQPHNRQMSMSLYLASIAVVDTIVLILGMCDCDDDTTVLLLAVNPVFYKHTILAKYDRHWGLSLELRIQSRYNTFLSELIWHLLHRTWLHKEHKFPGSIITRGNLHFVTGIICSHVVKPLIPILALLPNSSSLCKTLIKSVFFALFLLTAIPYLWNECEALHLTKR